MRQISVLGLIIFSSLFLVGQADVFTQMGLSGDDAKDQILDAVVSGTVPYQLVTQAFLAAPVSTRIAWIRGGFAWAKKYSSGAQFQKEYQTRRQDNMPQEAEKSGSFDEETAKQQAELNKQIAEMRKNLKQMPVEIRQQMEQTIKELEKQFKEQNEDPELQKVKGQLYQDMKRQGVADQQKKLQEYENSFPADPRLLIARHLQAFLDLSGGVDFAAKLEDRDGRKRFVNPAYEAKTNEWKLLFRAGKETVEAARAEAKLWLADLKSK